MKRKWEAIVGIIGGILALVFFGGLAVTLKKMLSGIETGKNRNAGQYISFITGYDGTVRHHLIYFIDFSCSRCILFNKRKIFDHRC